MPHIAFPRADRQIPVLSVLAASLIVEGKWQEAGVEPDPVLYVEACRTLHRAGLGWVAEGTFQRACDGMVEEGLQAA